MRAVGLNAVSVAQHRLDPAAQNGLGAAFVGGGNVDVEDHLGHLGFVEKRAGVNLGPAARAGDFLRHKRREGDARLPQQRLGFFPVRLIF